MMVMMMMMMMMTMKLNNEHANEEVRVRSSGLKSYLAIVRQHPVEAKLVPHFQLLSQKQVVFDVKVSISVGLGRLLVPSELLLMGKPLGSQLFGPS